jgi:hypothetical protein
MQNLFFLSHERFRNRARIRQLERKERRLYDRFERKLATAKTSDERYEIERDRYFESLEYREEIDEIRSKELVGRARKVHLSVADLPPSNGDDAPDHWYRGSFGNCMLLPASFRELEKRVESTEYEASKRAREKWEFWLRAVVATVGAIGGIVAAVTGLITVFRNSGH